MTGERRGRDPEGRRRAIIEAAGQVIAEAGVGGVTHRRVAEAAGVPVGSTTYYFTDLDELVRAALAHVADLAVESLRDFERHLDESADLPAALADLTADYLAERDRYRTYNDLYTAATHRPELRPLARVWSDGLIGILAPRIGPRAARAVTMYIDGALLHALINDEPEDTATLTAALAALASVRSP